MEILVLLWDEIDDLTGVCRHLAGSALTELATAQAPIAAAGSALAVWLLLLLP